MQSPAFIKDKRSGVVINTSDEEYTRMLAARKANRETKNLCSRMSALETELREIRDLLVSIASGRSN